MGRGGKERIAGVWGTECIAGRCSKSSLAGGRVKHVQSYVVGFDLDCSSVCVRELCSCILFCMSISNICWCL